MRPRYVIIVNVSSSPMLVPRIVPETISLRDEQIGCRADKVDERQIRPFSHLFSHLLAGKRPSAHVGQPTVSVADPLMANFWSSPFKLAFQRGLIAGCLQPTHFRLRRWQREPGFGPEAIALLDFDQVVVARERHARHHITKMADLKSADPSRAFPPIRQLQRPSN